MTFLATRLFGLIFFASTTSFDPFANQKLGSEAGAGNLSGVAAIKGRHRANDSAPETPIVIGLILSVIVSSVQVNPV
jgi:hypothetical protein